jgi:hypothetical protein
VTGRLQQYLYIFFLLLASPAAHAQDSTARPRPLTRFTSEADISRNMAFKLVDTATRRIEVFHNLYRQYTLFQDLGNIGTPAQSLFFRVERPTGFVASYNPFEGYFIKSDAARYYNTRTPYTDLFVALGSNELIYLTAKHYQNILPRWNVGVDFQRITSQGFLLRQYTSMYNYQFSTMYSSRNQRYALLANATWNRGIVEESGGIESDSAFNSLTGAAKRVFPNLNFSQTRYKGRDGLLKQYFRLGAAHTIVNAQDTIYDLPHGAQISLTTKVSDMAYIFENGTPLGFDTYAPLLPNRYYATGDTTTDSMYYGRFENRLGIDLYSSRDVISRDSLRRYLGVGIAHSFHVVSQNPYLRNFQNVTADISWEHFYIKKQRLSFDANASYVLQGYNAGDFSIRANSFYRFSSVLVLVNGMYQAFRPDFNYQLFKSNQFIWNNHFGKVDVLRGRLMLATQRLRNNFTIRVNQYLLNEWVYVDRDGTPAQLAGRFPVTTIEALKTFQLWRFWFEHHLIYQHSGSDVVRLPQLGGDIRYYYRSQFKAMRFEMGVNVFWYSSFEANNYNPATRLFFLQDGRKIGNYPLIEPFFTGEVKRLMFFLKYEHANQDWFNPSAAYATPGYPLSLSSFRYGARWRFYD